MKGIRAFPLFNTDNPFANVDRVSSLSCIDRGGTGDRLDINGIGTSVGIDGGNTRMTALDSQRIAAISKAQKKVVDLIVDQTTHAEAGDL